MKPFDTRILGQIVHFDVVDPTSEDDLSKGYAKGQLWINTVGQTSFICIDVADGEWMSLGGAGGITADGVATLTNKRIARRVVVSEDTSGTITLDCESYDMMYVSATGAIELAISGVPLDVQIVEFIIYSATTQNITYDGLMGTDDISLPGATTGSGKYDRLLFEYNDDSGNWELLAKNFGA